MPKFSQEEFEKQGKKIDDLEKDIKFLKDALLKVKGQPIVQGYAGKRFDLNENLNVVELFKYIDAWTIKVTNQIKFRFRATNEPKLYLERTADGGTTWTELTNW